MWLKSTKTKYNSLISYLVFYRIINVLYIFLYLNLKFLFRNKSNCNINARFIFVLTHYSPTPTLDEHSFFHLMSTSFPDRICSFQPKKNYVFNNLKFVCVRLFEFELFHYRNCLIQISINNLNKLCHCNTIYYDI